MKPTCPDVIPLLRREAEGPIGRREFDLLDRHVEACASCAAQRRRLDPLRLFASLREGEPASVDLWNGIRAGVQEQGRLGPWEGLGLLRPAWRLAGVAALVILLGLGALLQVPTVGPSGGDLPEMDGGDGPATATIESAGPSGARIYDMTVFGEGNEVTELVMIFDEEIDL